MKNILILVYSLISAVYSGQVILGKGKTALTNSSVSLEFGNEPRGLVLPWITSAVSVEDAVPGTLVFDASDRIVKLKHENTWQKLSPDNSGVVDASFQDKYVENATAKVAIGKLTTTPGILVLEDNDKAMILPLVTSYEDVKMPAAGMMVFDTTLKFLCLYNGNVWSFWKG